MLSTCTPIPLIRIRVNSKKVNLKVNVPIAGNSMHTLLSNDIEQVNQLYQFMAAMKRFHEEVSI